ncbi:MAG: ferrochelatase [Pseudomonadales bacterium]|jgi:ferrochelatase|nr:ferrochelatase [Pseudomonadales bacterium]
MPDRAVLLVNLGSPDSPTEPDVRRYLEEFLMDPRVVDLPWPIRRFIVSAFILPTRPKRSAEAYASIWSDGGSPLKVTTRELAEALDARLEMPVTWAMRYGTPSIEDRILELARMGITTLRYVPLYPHWAMSTTETSIVEAERVIATHGLEMTLEVQPPFYDDPDYIAELAATAREQLEPDDHLLFSYHGLPERQVRKCDPTGEHCLKRPDCCQIDSPAHATCYRHQVYVTSELIAAALGLSETQWEVAFQSRVGRAKWIEPYTDKVLEHMPERGIKKVAVMCPAFVADNLETLEEIGIEGRESFLEAGGERYKLIPCLNARPGWVDLLADWFTTGDDDLETDKRTALGMGMEAASGG